LATFSITRG